MPKDCPKCGLINPTEAERCDCGYDFVSRKVERPYLMTQLPKSAGLGIGAAMMVYIAYRVLRFLLQQ
jgi:hypothetical protein